MSNQSSTQLSKHRASLSGTTKSRLIDFWINSFFTPLTPAAIVAMGNNMFQCLFSTLRA